MTVPPSLEDRGVHLGAVRVEHPRERRRIDALGDAGVAADVRHQHGDRHVLGLAELAPAARAASRSGRREACGCSVSPCSSRSTIAFCNRRNRRSALSRPALASFASLRNRSSTASFAASGSDVPARRDRLDRASLADPLQQLLFALRRARRRRAPARPARSRSTDRACCRRSRPRVPPARADRRRRRDPSGGTRIRRRLRRAARSRTPGSSYCDRITTPVPGLRMRTSLAASMPSFWKFGGIRMSVTTTCGFELGGARRPGCRSPRRPRRRRGRPAPRAGRGRPRAPAASRRPRRP